VKYYPCMVLDITYRPFTIFSHFKSFVLVYSGKAEVVQNYETKVIRTVDREIPAPLVIRIALLSKHWEKVAPSRRAVFLRDNFTCAYCGKLVKDSEATIDHIVPRSRGGEFSWENLITACDRCNQKKGNKLPEEANMPLLFKPYRPTKFEVELKRWRINSEFEVALEIFFPKYKSLIRT